MTDSMTDSMKGADSAGQTAACTNRRRAGDEVITCGAPAFYTAIVAGGRAKAVCADCAAAYAHAGFLALPTEELCLTCLQKKPKRDYKLRCWCGSDVDVKRSQVDGVWFALCRVHQPPPLSDLWWRLWQKAASRFWWRRPSRSQLAETTAALIAAREKRLQPPKGPR